MLKRALPFLALLLVFVLMRFMTPATPPVAKTTGTVLPPPPSVGLGPQDASLPPLQKAQKIFTALDGMSSEQIKAQITDYQKWVEQSRQYNAEHATGFLARLLGAGPDGDKVLELGYAQERVADPKTDSFAEALAQYHQLGRGLYSPIADMRIAQIEENILKQNAPGSSVAQDARKQIMSALEAQTNLAPTAETLLRTPPVAAGKLQEWRVVPARETAAGWLDSYYRSDWRYQVFHVLVRLTGARKSFSYIFAIILMAVIAKLITTPFTASQFRSMRKMSVVQPELKKLQEKYKGNREELAKAQMALFKEHGVNPASSCLPMILQLVILWQVYFAIRHFLFQFWGVHFLYLPNLANPDVMPGLAGFPGPLLLLYAVSMYFSTKLTSMPAATPEQQGQQRMMSVMMPVLLLFFLKGLPAAFILYWLLQNILMTGHQWLIMRPHREEMAAANAGVVKLAKEAPKEKTLTPPPPAAIERLSQGTKPSQQKRKRKKRY